VQHTVGMQVVQALWGDDRASAEADGRPARCESTEMSVAGRVWEPCCVGLGAQHVPPAAVSASQLTAPLYLDNLAHVLVHGDLWNAAPAAGADIPRLLQRAPVHVLQHKQQAVGAGVVDHLGSVDRWSMDLSARRWAMVSCAVR
jgi:hypothetical protein